MSQVEVRALIDETANLLATSGSDARPEEHNLALSGLEVFALIANKVVFPLIVAVLGKLLGDAFTQKAPIDSVVALQATIDAIQLPQFNMSTAVRDELVADATLKLQGFGYSSEQANLLAGSVVSKIAKAFSAGAATISRQTGEGTR